MTEEKSLPTKHSPTSTLLYLEARSELNTSAKIQSAPGSLEVLGKLMSKVTCGNPAAFTGRVLFLKSSEVYRAGPKSYTGSLTFT